MKIKRGLLVACCLLIAFSGSSQMDQKNAVSTPNDTITITPDSIPVLQFFIDAALMNSPLLTSTMEDIKKIKEEIKLEKSNWMTLITLDANAKYGLYNQLIVNESAAGVDLDASLSNKQQLNYFAGVTLKIPISEFIIKKSKIKILQSGIDQAELKKEAIRREITTLIVDSYFNLKIKQETYKDLQEEYQAVYMSYLTSKREVEKGLITMEAYSGSISRNSNAHINLTKGKYEFFSEYTKLLILTGLNKFEKHESD